MKRNRENITDQQLEAIADILKPAELAHSPEEMLSLIRVRIAREFGPVDLPAIERALRKRRLKTVFLAVPTGILMESDGFSILRETHVSRLPGDKEDNDRPFTLYVCTHGETEARVTADLFGFKYDQRVNRDRLRETGLILPRPGTETARMDNAELN